MLAWLFIVFNLLADANSFKTVRFQSDGEATTSSYIHYKNSTIPELKVFTVCIRIKPLHVRGSFLPVISYSVPENADEIVIYWDVHHPSLEFICCHQTAMFVTNTTMEEFPLMIWTSLCVSVDLVQNIFKVSFRDTTVTGKIITMGGTSSVMGSGKLILGQEQDTYGGGFNVLQSYDGFVSNFVLVREFLGDEQIEEYLECRNQTFEPDISLEDDQHWELMGETTVTNTPREEFCRRDNSYLVVFPEKRSLDESLRLCKMLKGDVVTPESDFDNQRTLNSSVDFLSQCAGGYSVYLWLGFKYISSGRDTREVEKLIDGSYSPYSNITKRTVYGKNMNELCLYFHSHLLGEWEAYYCGLEVCVACNFTKPTAMRLRGLCEGSLIDKKYYIRGYEKGKPKLEGLMHSTIVFDGRTWRIFDSVYNNVTATAAATDVFSYPFGLRKWYIEGDLCPTKNATLLLTSCLPHQYTCNDGTCIRKMQRCDLTVNCPDQSDERFCSSVVVPFDYIKEVPPARVGKEPAGISLNVSILSMQPVDTLNLKISLVVLLTLKWRDPRLNMESLNYAENMNVIHDDDEIWQPSLVFEDVTGSEADLSFHWQTFVAVMESGPLEDDITRLKEDEVYPGWNNSLKLSKTYSLRFSCEMDLAAYPFDTQLCSFIIRLKDIPKEFVQLTVTQPGVRYTGAKNLKEYRVEDSRIELHDVGNFSGYKTTLVLANLSGFYVFTTYIPTSLMVIICYSTFLFSIEDFNDRIMVSLTALLVLATLFAQITQSTPKTAYLKLLDVWFVSCIMTDFVICILLVLINYLYERDKYFLSGPNAKLFKTVHNKKMSRCSPEQLNRIFIVCIPIIILSLTVVYIAGSLAYVL